MKDYQERVVAEKTALDEKITDLCNFMHEDKLMEPHEDKYTSVSAIEQGLLMVQLVAMKNYSAALSSRIESFVALNA